MKTKVLKILLCGVVFTYAFVVIISLLKLSGPNGEEFSSEKNREYNIVNIQPSSRSSVKPDLHDSDLKRLDFSSTKIEGNTVFFPTDQIQNINKDHHLFRISKKIDCSNNGIVLDVGSNRGFYTIIPASRGCRVHSFEIQKACIDITKATLNLNGIFDRVVIHNNPVSDISTILELPYDTVTCSSKYTFTRVDYTPKLPTGKKNFRSVVLDEMFPETKKISWMKVDVEGHEPQVLMGSKSLFKRKIIDVACFEFAAKTWNKPFSKKYNDEFVDLLKIGYHAKCLWVRYKSRKFAKIGGIEKQATDFTIDNEREFSFMNSKESRWDCVDIVFYLPERAPYVLKMKMYGG